MLQVADNARTRRAHGRHGEHALEMMLLLSTLAPGCTALMPSSSSASKNAEPAGELTLSAALMGPVGMWQAYWRHHAQPYCAIHVGQGIPSHLGSMTAAADCKWQHTPAAPVRMGVVHLGAPYEHVGQLVWA